MMAPTKNRTRPTAAAVPISGTPMRPTSYLSACVPREAGLLVISSSHRPGFVRHYYNDGTRPKDVTDGRTGLAGTAIRGAQKPPEGGGLPDARLAFRGGRCRPGSLAASQPLRDERRREPGRMADQSRRTSVPGHATLAHLAACDAPGRAPRVRAARHVLGAL